MNKKVPESESFYQKDIPEGIINEQNCGKDDKGKSYKRESTVYLFFSFDIVNSTEYKYSTNKWSLVITRILEQLRSEIVRKTQGISSILWRVIGDELVFYVPIYDMRSLINQVEDIYSITLELSRELKSGKLIDEIENKKIDNEPVNNLSIKAAAWIAIVGQEMGKYTNLETYYTIDSEYNQIIDYIGPDIDAGFRIKEYTQHQQMVLSYELAYILSRNNVDNKTEIIGYKELKGIWNGGLYPIIWFYDTEIYARVIDVKADSIVDTFEYDEANKNELVRNYVRRKRMGLENDDSMLSKDMYEPKKALEKICNDRRLGEKIDQIEGLIKKGARPVDRGVIYRGPSELHVAVVCCDTKEKKVMICRRTSKRDRNPGKWEFGCAEMRSDERLIDKTIQYYKEVFELDIELITDKKRDEKQPIPLALYEVEGKKGIKKGIIVVGRVNAGKGRKLRSDRKHDEVQWISMDDIQKYEENAVRDLGVTVRKVFNNWEELFEEHKDE